MRNYVIATEFVALDRGMGATLSRIATRYGEIENKAQRASQAVSRRMEPGGMFGSITAGNLAAQGIANVTTGFYDLSKQMAATKATMNAVFGEEKAARNMEYLRSETNRLGVALPSVMQGYNQLLISIQKSNFREEDLRKFTTSFMEFSSATGLAPQHAERAFYAFNQMFSKQKIMGEELNQQLGDIPALNPEFYQAIADVYSIPFKSVRDYMSKPGVEVDAAKVFKRVTDLMHDKWATPAQKMSEQYLANLNRLTNKQAEVAEMFGAKAFGPMAEGLSGILSVATPVLKFIDEYSNEIIAITGAVVLYNQAEKIRVGWMAAETGAGLIGGLRMAAKEYKALAAAQGAANAMTLMLNASILASPIFWAVAGLAGLAVVTKNLYDEMKYLEETPAERLGGYGTSEQRRSNVIAPAPKRFSPKTLERMERERAAAVGVSGQDKELAEWASNKAQELKVDTSSFLKLEVSTPEGVAATVVDSKGIDQLSINENNMGKVKR